MRAVITVANPLKAAGRTSAVVHLGTELALRGYRTLVIDLDHQADLTYHFVPPDLPAVRRHSSYFPLGRRTLTDVLVGSTAQGGSFTDDGDARLDAVLTDTVVPLLWLAPSTLRLGLFNMSHALAVTRLAAELDTLRERFEFVLIDTPRSQTRLLDAALYASTHLLVTAAPHSYLKEAVALTMLRLEGTRRVNPRLNLLGIFRNRVDPHNQESSNYAQLRDKYGDAVCERAVYLCPHTELCSERHLPVQLSELQSRGADGYASLADELLGRMGVARSKHTKYHQHSNGEHRAPLRDVTPNMSENEQR